MAYAAQKVDQAAGVSEVAVLTGQVVDMESASGLELAGAAGATAVSGEMADFLAGAVDGSINAVAGTVGIRPLARGPIYGHEEAFANGRVVAQGAAVAGETAVFVSGTMGLGALSLPAAGGAAAAGAGVLAVTAEAGGVAAAGGNVAGAGLYVAASTAANMGNQGGGGNAPSSVKDVLDELPGKTGKTGPIKNVPDEQALDDLFNSLSSGGKTIDPGPYPGIVKELPDGTIVRIRPSSKSGGATIDITLPGGKIYKIHMGS